MSGPVQYDDGRKQSAVGSLTVSATFPNPSTPGNSLVMLVAPGGSLSGAQTSITDDGATGANVWELAFDHTDTDQVQLWICSNPVESITTATLNLDSTVGSGIQIFLTEEAGQYTIPAAVFGTDYNVYYYKGGFDPQPAPITTAAANVIARSALNQRGSGIPDDSGSGYTLIAVQAQTGGTIWTIAHSYLDVPAAGTQVADTWNASANSDTLTIAYQLVPASTGPQTDSGTSDTAVQGTPAGAGAKTTATAAPNSTVGAATFTGRPVRAATLPLPAIGAAAATGITGRHGTADSDLDATPGAAGRKTRTAAAYDTTATATAPSTGLTRRAGHADAAANPATPLDGSSHRAGTAPLAAAGEPAAGSGPQIGVGHLITAAAGTAAAIGRRIGRATLTVTARPAAATTGTRTQSADLNITAAAADTAAATRAHTAPMSVSPDPAAADVTGGKTATGGTHTGAASTRLAQFTRALTAAFRPAATWAGALTAAKASSGTADTGSPGMPDASNKSVTRRPARLTATGTATGSGHRASRARLEVTARPDQATLASSHRTGTADTASTSRRDSTGARRHAADAHIGGGTGTAAAGVKHGTGAAHARGQWTAALVNTRQLAARFILRALGAARGTRAFPVQPVASGDWQFTPRRSWAFQARDTRPWSFTARAVSWRFNARP